MQIPMNLQRLYNHVIAPLQDRSTLNQEKNMCPMGERRGEKGAWSIVAMVLLLLVTLLPSPFTPRAYAWTWDDDESGTKDELDMQVQGYRKRVEQGISLQERVVLLDRLIKLYKIRNRDARPLEAERAQVLSDELAVQNVSAAARQKSQTLFQQAFELVQKGDYKQAQDTFMEAERLNPADKSLTELRQKMESVASILPVAPTPESASGDLVRKGIMQFLQNDPSKSLNFLLYAQQKDGKNAAIPKLVDLVKRMFPNESSEILDARL